MASEYETSEFDEAYKKYKEVIKDRLSKVSLFSKGIISEKDLDQRLAGMTIYQDQFKETMEEQIEDMESFGIDATELQSKFDYIVKSSEDTDFLIEKVKKQYEVNERRLKVKNRDESRNHMRLFLATRDDGKMLLDVLKDTIYDATNVGKDLNNIKIDDIDLSKIDLA